MSTSPEAKQAAEEAGYYGFGNTPAQPGYIYAKGYDAAKLREDESEMFKTLSDILTGGNASTWAQVVHAAQQLAHQQPSAQ